MVPAVQLNWVFLYAQLYAAEAPMPAGGLRLEPSKYCSSHQIKAMPPHKDWFCKGVCINTAC